MAAENKKKLYLLLPVVLGLWGYIFFKIISSISPTETVNYKTYQRPTADKLAPKNETALKLSALNYPDPFLKQTRRKYTAINPSLAINAQKAKELSALEKFRPYGYKGYIEKKNRTQRVALVTLNGRQHLAKAGEQIGAIKILNFNKEMVVLSIEGKRYEIGVE